MIPSYDDLTPGIPDVPDTGRDEQLALFIARTSAPAAVVPASGSQREPCLPAAAHLYACLRGQPREALIAVARDFSPRVMAASDGEILLDVSGLGALIGEPPVIARELRRALLEGEVDGSVAIAPTQTIARLLAAAGPARTGMRERIDDLPVTMLQPLETLPPAMGDRDRAQPYETFQRWGIATLGDLAALPAAGLSSRLGRRGIALQRLARGLDPRPFVPDGDTPRYIGRLELEWPIAALEPLSFVFARLLEPLAAALERADRGAVAIRLDLRLTDRSTDTRLLPLPAPMRDPRVLRTLLLLDLESGRPFNATGEVMIDVVSIELDPAPARITQFSLLQRALPSPETLSTLTARLSALVGASRIGSPVLVDTHEPGAFAMQPLTLGAAAGSRLPAADVAAAADSVLRRQRIPPAIRVSVEHGRPVHLAAVRRGLPHGAVVQAAGPWRASGGWWTGPVPPKLRSSEGGWNRDEWDVALASGAICRIFQERVSRRWFLDAVYD